MRWACQLPPPDSATPGACEVVRVQPWIPWNFNTSRLCAHLPGLVKKVKAADEEAPEEPKAAKGSAKKKAAPKKSAKKPAGKKKQPYRQSTAKRI